MNNAENDTQQLHIYRALTSIFNDRLALSGLIKLGVIDSIIRGMKRFTKISIHTSGLQLLSTVVNNKEGLEAAKSGDLKTKIVDACNAHDGDDVVTHLMKEVVSKL